MIELGKYNTLKVVKKLDFGIYMDGGNGLEILMPKRYVPTGTKVGDELRCIVYRDSEGRLLATTERAEATVGEFASLRVIEVNEVGAFLDWGVSKELLVPHREQAVPMQAGRRYIVHIYVDERTERIVGSARLRRFLDNVPPQYEPNEEVEILVMSVTPLGYKVIINNLHTGMLYRNQIFRPIAIGDRLRAYVKQVREDDKIDLSLQPIGYQAMVDGVEAAILKALHLNNGFLNIGDKSDPEVIAGILRCSKKSFKKAAGALYKQGRIRITDEGIYLLSEDDVED